MKKVALILCLAMLLGIGVVSAEINRNSDYFSGGVSISSHTTMTYPVDRLSLIKTTGSASTEYSIFAKVTSSKEFSLVKTFIELKIDDAPTHSIDIREGSSLQATDNRYMISSSIKVPLAPEYIDEIKNAKRVALRFQTLGGYTPIYVLPDNVLAEWKEVIATEK